MFAKLIKHKFAILTVIGIVAVAVILQVMSPALDNLLFNLTASNFPDVAKIYHAEQTAFPQDTIGVTKNYGTVTSYDVELTAGSMPPASDAATAAKVACATGLTSGTAVEVTTRRQYYLLPFFESATTPESCP